MADNDGFVLVFDEMITGIRWSFHGAQHLYGVVPDLSAWGKTLGNGFAIAALAGKRLLLELGGLRTPRRACSCSRPALRPRSIAQGLTQGNILQPDPDTAWHGSMRRHYHRDQASGFLPPVTKHLGECLSLQGLLKPSTVQESLTGRALPCFYKKC